MLNFAGPVVIELPWPVYLMLGLLFLTGIIGAIVLFLAFTKFSIKVRSQNTSTANSKTQTVFSSYLAGTFVDGVSTFVLVYLLGVSGAFGDWSNEAWHMVVRVAVALFLFTRLLSRLLYKVSLGELLLKTKKYETRNYLFVSLSDILIAISIYLYMNSL
jgi:hypothetical protein